MLREQDLNQFTGTEHWYKHPMSGYVYTDGVQYLASEGSAYWLIDKILICMKCLRKLQNQEFVAWVLKVNKEDDTAVLTADDGNRHVLYTEKIDYTDFPLDQVELWFEHGVLILPSEH